MKKLKVGGAVRDHLLGLASSDIDWVVIGETAKSMVAAGFQPVGKSFPVYLCPKTRQEYALARSEDSKGHAHFGPEVTLEEDLYRRDLSINSMAMTETGVIVDPWGGLKDVSDRVLRHTSESFRVDPMRILRVARFMSRWPEFTVHPSTMALMQQMVNEGVLDSYVPERVTAELVKGLMGAKPSRMLTTLKACGALKKILPELDCLWGIPQVEKYHPEVCTGIHIEMAVDYASKINAPAEVRMAVMLHDVGKGVTEQSVLPHHYKHEVRGGHMVKEIAKRLVFSGPMKSLAVQVAFEHGNIHACMSSKQGGLFRLLDRVGAYSNKTEKFEQLLLACECDARGRLGLENRLYPQVDYLRSALKASGGADMEAIVAESLRYGGGGEYIKEALQTDRTLKLKAWLRSREESAEA